MSFIDSLRNSPPEAKIDVYGGFDPDLHVSGLGLIEVHDDGYGTKRVEKILGTEIICDGKLSGLEAVKAILKDMRMHWMLFEQINYAIVECQQVYPPKGGQTQRQVVAKLVGQGNDLLMLALIAGAASNMFKPLDSDCLRLPSQWKGQQKKPAMRERAMKVLRNHPIKEARLNDDKVEWQQLFAIKGRGAPSSSHVVDAIMMAMVRADLL